MIQLAKEIRTEVNQTISIFKQIPWHESPLYYANWLAQTYYFAVHSSRLLTLCGSRLDDRILHERFTRHATEEFGHEKLLISDCEKLSYKISDFKELPSTSVMYQTQYYWIEHKDPLSFLGYTVFLEKLAADFGPTLFEILKKNHTTTQLKFISVHSKEDIEHSEDSLKRIEEFSKTTQELIAQNARQTGFFYRCMLKDIQNMNIENLQKTG